MPRPTRVKDNSQQTALMVLIVGGAVVLGLVMTGIWVWMRANAAASAVSPAAPQSVAPVVSAERARLEPSRLLAEARRKASAWQQDAVLVSLTMHPLDARGVAPQGSVELTYARPGGQRISGGAEAGAQRLKLRTSGGELMQHEERAAKSRIAPEPNCVFEDAWAAAQRAGAATNANLRMRYLWSDKHARPVWEVLSAEGEVLRRLDGVSCSILTR
ncbi:MAG TPA: hypothetical protein VJN18_30935 [Polyangiaceae bacterium]|nr:hypothetical protein [Polyangiaceae bacterium]